MNKLLVCLFAFLIAASAVESCGRRSRGGGGGNVNFASRNPIIISPTPAPTPPPPPPPLPNGWVPQTKRGDAQAMTRSNCQARITFGVPDNVNQNSLNRIDIQEVWLYTCTFNVYVEIEMGLTAVPQSCACMAWVGKQTGAVNDTFVRQQSTTIDDFNLVAFDYRAKAPGDPFAKRVTADFLANGNTTQLVQQATEGGMVFQGFSKGWAGKLTLQPTDYPPQLIQGNPKYSQFFVPAMCFGVTEKYTSTYKWPEPPYPLMHTSPNIWMTDCVQWREFVPLKEVEKVFSKRSEESVSQATATFPPGDNLWPKFFREFLLFPIGAVGQAGGVSNAQPARYMTSFYNDSNCFGLSGMITFDRRFRYTLSRDRGTYGSFKWERFFFETLIIGGAPKSFSGQDQYNVDGYTTVTWFQTIGALGSGPGNYRKGVIADILAGTTTTGQANLGPQSRFCTKVPQSFYNCTPGAQGCDHVKFIEKELVFAIVLGADAPADFPAKTGLGDQMVCHPFYKRCTSDKTRLSFQNFGNLARDYAKRRGSVLLTGPRKDFCTETPELGFDTLFFVPLTETSQLTIIKRSAKQAAGPQFNFVESKNGKEDLISANVAPLDNPGVGNVLLRAGIGSANEFGQPAGDHPVQLFPETYTAPITVNPLDASFDGVNAGEWDSSAIVCLEGSLGCSCRLQTSRVACDAPLECNKANYCARPECPVGAPGCACNAQGGCTEKSYQCDSVSKTCLFKRPCTAGTLGCQCKAGAVCEDAGTICSDCEPKNLNDDQIAGLNFTGTALVGPNGVTIACDGVCLKKTSCLPSEKGQPGCPCDAGSCKTNGFVCDSLTQICQTPTCLVGSPGCFCAESDRCAANYVCNADKMCVKQECTPGNKGCPCDPSTGCSDPKFVCKSMDKSNSEYKCVSDGPKCGDNTRRCTLFCGARRVLNCPPCANQKIICRADGAAAIAVPSAILIVILAILSML